MDTENDYVETMTKEELRSYNVLQTWIVLLDNLFCTFFVGCITLMAYSTGNWKLMWFYLLPFFAYAVV